MTKWMFEFRGEEKDLKSWCDLYDREYSSACKLARKGHSIEQILFSRNHGFTGTKIYHVWLSMRARCGHGYYKNVTICKRWRDSFRAFLEDMGPMPSEFHQIDRINSRWGYCPDNCRWVTPSENSVNRKSTRWVTYRGETKCLSQWARERGIKMRTLKYRLDNSWDLEKAFSKGSYE